MPLKNFFNEQLQLLRHFLEEPSHRVRCVRIAPDLTPLFMKMLAGLEKDENNPHLLLCCEAPFESPRQYFEALLRELTEEVSRWELPLKAAGFELRLPAANLAGLSPDRKFVAYASALADAFPDFVGYLVVVLVPDRVADAAGYRQVVELLARQTPSRWLKYLVLDEHKSPALDRIDEWDPRIWVQPFHLTPEEIEARAQAALERGSGLTAEETRQYTALLAGFAYARKEHDRALQLQKQWVEMVGPDGPAAEAANALYNLANTHLARKDFAAAEETYGKALELALDNRLDVLVPMVLTNLGVALYRQKRWEEALRSFRIARDTCKAQDLRPTEAHVLDCMGRTYEADGKLDEAEQCWREALAVYDGITSETFADGRAGGKALIQEQLARVAEARRQTGKSAKQPAKAGWFGWRKGA
jgi:tetratricopeptide (TPR) repeat protein